MNNVRIIEECSPEDHPHVLIVVLSSSPQGACGSGRVGNEGELIHNQQGGCPLRGAYQHLEQAVKHDSRVGPVRAGPVNWTFKTPRFNDKPTATWRTKAPKASRVALWPHRT